MYKEIYIWILDCVTIRSLHTLGVEEAKTIHDRSIRIYNKERTICDMIRNRSSMDIAILNEGINPQILLRNYMIDDSLRQIWYGVKS